MPEDCRGHAVLGRVMLPVIPSDGRMIHEWAQMSSIRTRTVINPHPRKVACLVGLKIVLDPRAGS